MKSELRFYASLLLKRLPIVVVLTGLATAVAAYVAATLPASYRTEALLLVESPQIPDEMASSTVQDNAPEQLDIIEQRLLTRANLLDIANELNVFPNRTDMVPDDVVDQMRAHTLFSTRFGRDQATTLTIAFTNESPEVTAAVVNEYVTRVLDENVRLRTGLAEQTLDFFEQEVARLGEDLSRQSARILEFKNQNIDALPEGMDYRMNRQAMLMERRSQLERDKSSIQDMRDRITQIFQATGQLPGSAQEQMSPAQQALVEARRELETARSIYSETNPRLRVLAARVAQLEREVAGTAGAGSTSSDPSTALFDMQMSELDARAASIDEQLKLLVDELTQIEDSIARTPANAITLQALERDYANISARYDAASQRLATAAVGERIELTAKGQRISVLRQAVVPREPTSPNRPLILAAGIAAGLGLSGALVVLLELLNRTVRRPADLTRALQISPLGTLPYIATSTETVKRRGAVLAVVALLAVGLPACLYFLHVEYMPLDLLADKAMSRMGL
jgi:polysaccharide chain length determinant protein (PEP-CTERM system associated)